MLDNLVRVCYNKYIKSKGDITMKKFIYMVKGFEFVDTEAFGKAWQDAKAKAIELHCPIFRQVIKADGSIRQQVYYKGGCFNSTEFMRADNVEVF